MRCPRAAASGHDTFAELDATDIANLMAKLPSRAIRGAAFYVTQLGAPMSLYRLASATSGIATLNNGPHYCGFPIRVTASLPRVTTALLAKAPLLFGDLPMAATLANRRRLSVAT